MAIRKLYYDSANKAAIMEQIVADFFMPLAHGFWSRYHHHFGNCEEDDAKAEAVIMCWRKMDNFDPAKGGSYSYFTEIVSRVYFGDSVKTTKYASRFFNESGFGDDEW